MHTEADVTHSAELSRSGRRAIIPDHGPLTVIASISLVVPMLTESPKATSDRTSQFDQTGSVSNYLRRWKNLLHFSFQTSIPIGVGRKMH